MMQAITTTESLPRELRLILRRERIWAEGRCDAFRFALECNLDVSCIQSEIAWYERILSDPVATAQGQPYSPGTSVRLNAEGCLVGLKDALMVIMRGADANALHHEIFTAEGRRDAFLFAQNCQGDITQINAEIKWYEAVLANSSNTASDQPYAPNTSVRLHVDGYLAGLKDALKILLQAEENQPQALSRVAEPSTNTYRVAGDSRQTTTDGKKKRASVVKRPSQKASTSRNKARRHK